VTTATVLTCLVIRFFLERKSEYACLLILWFSLYLSLLTFDLLNLHSQQGPGRDAAGDERRHGPERGRAEGEGPRSGEGAGRRQRAAVQRQTQRFVWLILEKWIKRAHLSLYICT